MDDSVAWACRQGAARIGVLRLVQSRHRHDHPGRAEAALKCLLGQEGLLHRMQVIVPVREPLDRGDRLPDRPDRGVDAAVHGQAGHVHGARAAVSRVAAFLHPEPALLPQVGTQALTRRGFGRRRNAVDDHS